MLHDHLRCQVTPLEPSHAEAVQQLASDPILSATTRLPRPYPPDGAARFIRMLQTPEGRTDFLVLAILDAETLVGVVGLHGLSDPRGPELGYWIGRRYWGRGYATYGVGMMLANAFVSLKLPVLRAAALESHAASLRVLQKLGFSPTGHEPHTEPNWDPSARLAWYRLTLDEWQGQRHARLTATLHPGLKELLELELAAGNRIADSGAGWPEKDSVLLLLERPFLARPALLPAGVVFREVNDPHWWLAEYGSEKPVQILGCRFG